MTNLFVDTDIIIDLLGDRKDFSLYAARIFSLGLKKEVKVYTSSNSIATTYYILSQRLKMTQADKLIFNFLKHIEIIPVDKSILERVFSSKFGDIEDAIQYFAALSKGDINFIVTRNITDYKLSSIPVYSSNEILQLI